MPELPDVEIFRRYLAKTSLHKKITRVEVRTPRILEGVTGDRLNKAVTGSSLKEASRHGKYLFGILDNGNVLVFHFGMTGFLRYFKNPEDEPGHGRLALYFQNGYRLVYDNRRLLGRVTLVAGRDDFIRKKQLGPDAQELNFDGFNSILERSRGILKSTLMNQKALAGLGNIYSDEILFQAGVHPKVAAGKTGRSRRHKLYESMRRVLEVAIASQALPQQMPKKFLLPNRKEGARCPRCGGRVKKIMISGRSAYICPSCQSE